MVFLLLQLLIFFFIYSIYLLYIILQYGLKKLLAKIYSQHFLSSFHTFCVFIICFVFFDPLYIVAPFSHFLIAPSPSPLHLLCIPPLLSWTAPPPPPFPLLPLPNSPAYQVSNKKANSFLLLRRLAKISTIYSGQ